MANDESSIGDDAGSPIVHCVEVGDVRPMRQRYLRPGQPPDAVHYTSDDDKTASHYAVRDDRGVVIGTGSMVFANRVAGVGPYRTPGARVRGMAVEERLRRRGIGRAILEKMIRVAIEAGIEEVWVNGREGAFEFFTACGFRNVSSEFEIPDLGRHIVMARPTRQPRRRTDVDPSPDPNE